MVNFAGYVGKGNNRGVGFITIPKQFRNQFVAGSSVKVEFKNSQPPFSFYGAVTSKRGVGVYVPGEINKRYDVVGKGFEISLDVIDGFFAVAGDDGRVYIPLKTASDLGLKRDSIIQVSAGSGDANEARYCRVRFRERKHTTEYVFFFGSDFSLRGAIFKIHRVIEKSHSVYSDIMPLIEDLNFGSIDNKRVAVFDGKKEGIIINDGISIADAAYYLGAFFADGTKKGNSWGIAASTFEQARYYVEQHKKLIDSPRFRVEISITSNEDVDKTSIMNRWAKETGVFAENIRIHRTETTTSENRNEFGSFLLREHRKLVQDYYNRLLCHLHSMIKNRGNSSIATDFILGVLEGDGYPSGSNKYGHIMIATNKDDTNILQDVLKSTPLDFKAHEELKTKKHYIRINSLSVLKNLPDIYKKIFIYYPKRRKKFIERFQNIGAVKFILGKQPYASSWVKAYLKRNGILDESYELTAYGNEIKKCLIDMENELKVVKV